MIAEVNQIIPIVFSVDDNYAPFLGVTLESIIQNNRVPEESIH